MDREAVNLLPQAVASSLDARLDSEFDLIGYTIKGGDKITPEMCCEAVEAIVDMSQPAPDELILQALLKLRSLTVSRAIGGSDLDLALEAYTEKLRGYPADAVIEALDKAPGRSKWFPAWQELKEEVEYNCRHRTMIFAAITRKYDEMQASPKVAKVVKAARYHG